MVKNRASKSGVRNNNERKTEKPAGKNGGRKSKFAPSRLAKKLLQIREQTGLNQTETMRVINPSIDAEANRSKISQYENGSRIPPMFELWNYAKLGKVTIEELLDDSLDLGK